MAVESWPWWPLLRRWASLLSGGAFRSLERALWGAGRGVTSVVLSNDARAGSTQRQVATIGDAAGGLLAWLCAHGSANAYNNRPFFALHLVSGAVLARLASSAKRGVREGRIVKGDGNWAGSVRSPRPVWQSKAATGGAAGRRGSTQVRS